MATVIAINPYEAAALPAHSTGRAPQKTSIVRIVTLLFFTVVFLVWTCGVYTVGYSDGWEQGMGEVAVQENTIVPEKRHRNWWGMYESRSTKPKSVSP